MDVYLDIEDTLGQQAKEFSEALHTFLAMDADLCAKLRLRKSFEDADGYIPQCTESPAKHRSCHGLPSITNLVYPPIVLQELPLEP